MCASPSWPWRCLICALISMRPWLRTKPAARSLDLARGLVGHWTFDEGKGSIARDVSGRDNHGTVMGGAKWNMGIIGGALEFDGTG